MNETTKKPLESTFLYKKEMNRIEIGLISSVIGTILFAVWMTLNIIDASYVLAGFNGFVTLMFFFRSAKYYIVLFNVKNTFKNKPDNKFYIIKTYKWSLHRKIVSKYITLKYLVGSLLYLLLITIIYFSTNSIPEHDYYVALVIVDAAIVFMIGLHYLENYFNKSSISISKELGANKFVDEGDLQISQKLLDRRMRQRTRDLYTMLFILPIFYRLYFVMMGMRDYSKESVDTLEINTVK